MQTRRAFIRNTIILALAAAMPSLVMAHGGSWCYVFRFDKDADNYGQGIHRGFATFEDAERDFKELSKIYKGYKLTKFYISYRKRPYS